MTEEEKWNRYFYTNSNVLKNKLNIKDSSLLKKKEYEIVAKKNILLYLDDVDNFIFNSDRLKNIHKYLFEDIYSFAGEYRKVNMGKDRRAAFLDYKKIEQILNELLNNIDDKLNITSDFLYAESLATLYWKILEIHPFREGNGRTVREFVRELVLSNNKKFENIEYSLDFNLNESDKDKLEKSTIESTRGNLVIMFYNMLKKNNKIKERTIK